MKMPAFSFPAIPVGKSPTPKEIVLGIKRECKSCKVYKLYRDRVSVNDFGSSVSSRRIPVAKDELSHSLESSTSSRYHSWQVTDGFESFIGYRLLI
jgi:hypothetical protein